MTKSLEARKAELQAELDKIKEQEKTRQDARSVVIGRVVDVAMNDDPELKAKIHSLLDSHLRKNAERKLFDLAPIPTKRGRPSASSSPPEVS